MKKQDWCVKQDRINMSLKALLKKKCLINLSQPTFHLISSSFTCPCSPATSFFFFYLWEHLIFSSVLCIWELYSSYCGSTSHAPVVAVCVFEHERMAFQCRHSFHLCAFPWVYTFDVELWYLSILLLLSPMKHILVCFHLCTFVCFLLR